MEAVLNAPAVNGGDARLPETWCVPVIRADFSDHGVWERLTGEIRSPTGVGFGATVDFVEDRTLSGLSGVTIAAGFPRDYPARYRHPVLFVVDSVTVALPEHPLLVVNLNERVDASPFRTVPRQVQSIGDNLSLANMDFDDFARSTGPDGVFRGF
ncbi:hypothetical protein [Micromonospora sp. NPDC005174]|uniref:DUF6924 domain-containing protein n=1 Tax=unclassified Micromonospora TaxID=2617518 RepID=UPI0033AE7DC4